MFGVKELVVVIFVFTTVSAQSYEDKRCRCICPSPGTVLNSTLSKDRKLFISNVPPSQCNCDGVILPRVGDEIKGRELEFCPRCECKYETRNTTVIKVVVILVIWMLTLLLIYMGFIMCLKPLMSRKNNNVYQDFANDESRNLLLQDIED